MTNSHSKILSSFLRISFQTRYHRLLISTFTVSLLLLEKCKRCILWWPLATSRKWESFLIKKSLNLMWSFSTPPTLKPSFILGERTFFKTTYLWKKLKTNAIRILSPISSSRSLMRNTWACFKCSFKLLSRIWYLPVTIMPPKTLTSPNTQRISNQVTVPNYT